MSKIFDLIPEEDKEKIEQYIHWFGPSRSDMMDWNCWTGLESVLSEWADQKEKTLLKLMDNQLILRRPYTYTAQTEGLSKVIREHTNEPAFTAFQHWWEWTLKRTAGNTIEILNPDGSKKDLHWFAPWSYPGSCFDSYVLACNAYQDDDVIVVFPSGKKMKMFKGMKPMKILHRFVEEFNGPEDLYDAFRTWHSMQLNQKKMDGELCLSIHPLDYMTMSDNANNWESCMRWTNKYSEQDTHGDFRAGTVECMNSPYIIEAYLHNPAHEYKIDNWTWNSKQWRELFIVQEGIINEIKGYCFQDENLTNTALMWIKELAAKNLGWTYEAEEQNVKGEILLDNGDKMYFSFDPTQYMYNDMGTLKVHRGRINKKVLFSDKYRHTEQKSFNSDNWSYFIEVPYGGQATCMCCGQPYEGEHMSNMVFCDRCDYVRVCACCGDVIDEDGSYYIEDIDDYYCENCYCDNCINDSLTGECHLSDNITEVKILYGYDDCQKPVFDDNYTMWVYEPEDNWEYQKVFNAPPKKIKMEGYYNTYDVYAVTLDMVNDGYVNQFMSAFDVYPRPKYLSDMAVDYLDTVFYDTDMNPLYQEENDDD